MKTFTFYSMICVPVVVFVFASGPAVSQEGSQSEKILFTKHFQESLFDVTEHATYKN